MEGGRRVALRGVLFTDMVGSTALRSRLGDDRADTLRRDHYEILGSTVTAHGGRVLRWTGDGIKADFPSASAALAAALQVQREVAEYGRRARAVSPFEVRIGVSAGEVVLEGNDAHGIAVIEAARLEPLAEPGGILATALARRLAERRVEADFEAVGSFSLKGLDDPAEVVRVVDRAEDPGGRLFARSLVVDRRFPLVGRGTEVGQALDAWRTARAGSPATVFVEGPTGIGKSRLVAQVVDHAHAEGAIVLAGSCDSDLAVPYEPFALAFAEAAAVDDELARAVASGTGPLGALFPTRGPRERVDDAGASERFELFEAVVGLVERLAAEHPVVLVLDDLHWAASPTVQLLRHLVRRAEDTALLVLASLRPDELPPGHPLQELRTELRAAGSAVELPLVGLDAGAVAELVAARLPAAPDDRIRSFATRLCDESAGSPFFTCELLHHLTATGALERAVLEDDAPSLPLPDTVREVVEQRLARLPPGTGDLLSTAAVVGASFDLDLLAALTDLGTTEVLDRCEDLVRRALLQEVGAGRFAFTHALVRTSLLDGLSASRRALAHGRVAEAIEALGRDDHDELAHHWLLAGVDDRADASLERAADRDLEALAFESASERYQELVEHHRTDASDVAPLARAWLGLGLARRALGQPEYLDAIEEAGRLGRRLQDVDLLAAAAIASIWPGNFFVSAGRTETRLIELCEDALRLLDDEDPRRARVLSTLAAHLTFDPDRGRRVGLLEEAEAISRRSGDPELVGSVLVAEHIALWDPTTVERRAAIAVEVARLARATGDVDLAFFGGFLQAFSAAERGDLETARQRLAQLAEPITATQNFYFGFLAERLGVSLDVFAGTPGVQARVDALAKRYAGTHADTDGTWALQTGHLALQAGRFAEVLPSIRAMVEGSAIGPTWQAPFALALLAAGQREEAEAVYADLPERNLDYFWITTALTEAEVALGLGRLDRLPHHIEQLEPHRHLLGIAASGTLCFGLVATTLGQLALALGDHDEAEELLAAAVERADAMGAAFESVKARRLLATCRAAVGRPYEELVATALSRAEAHGFAGEREALAPLAG